MLVRSMPNGQVLCVNQTSHGLMAAEFCRHWGNVEFERPKPYHLVMDAIAQHDNGWYEWESAPKLGVGGAPLAFIPGPIYHEKIAIWQLGIDRAAAQHPYMGMMVSRHAALLYTADINRLEGDERRATEEFIARQEVWIEEMRQWFANDETLRHAATEPVLMAHTRLLQFGDSSSLQVSMPWSKERIFVHCPVDFVGNYTSITMRWEGNEITYDPWPFDVEHFTVTVHGKLLDQATFPDDQAYQAALAVAPLHVLTWHVVRK